LQQLRRDAERASARQPLLSNTLLWCAAAFAFSPVIVDLARHLVAEPWSRYSAIFLPLLVATAAREETAPPPHRAGYAWLAAGLVIALIAVAGGEPRLGRVGLPLGIIGLCRARGFGSWRTLLLAFWIVPIPHVLSSLGSPEIESLYLRLAAAVAGVFGPTIAIEQATASVGGAVLKLSEANGGLPLVALLSGLGWYAGLRARSDLPASVARALGWGLLAFPVQALGVLCAVVSLTLGTPELGRFVLAHALWAATAVLGLACASRADTSATTRATLTSGGATPPASVEKPGLRPGVNS